MSISDYLRSNEARMRQMRQGGETWETIAELIENETGESVNLASIRKTYSRLFGVSEASEAPARVEKRVEKTVTKRPTEKPIANIKHDAENIFKSKLDELDKIINESQSKLENAINSIKNEQNKLMNESSEYLEEAISKYTDMLNSTKYPNQNLTYNHEDNTKENRNWIIFTRIMYPFSMVFMILSIILSSALIYKQYNKPDEIEIWKGLSLSDETLSIPEMQR